MHVIDLSSLQSLPDKAALESFRQFSKLVAALRAHDIAPKSLLLVNAGDIHKTRHRLIDLVKNEDVLYLDLPEVAEEISISLLSRFMVTQQIHIWWQLPQLPSLIPQSVLTAAAQLAGVRLIEPASDPDFDQDLFSRAEFARETGNSTPDTNARPALAIVAPYPPVKSGVADYVAQQVAHLKEYYQLTLVHENGEESDLPHDFPGRAMTYREFLARPELHQRVLYHIGNSPAHLPALMILADVPGLVILHDFFLSDVQQYEDIMLRGQKQASFAPLVYSHGYRPLLQAVESKRTPLISDYPCNLKALERARKALVHSAYVEQEARHWYGDPILQKLGRIGFAKEVPPLENRDVSKRALGFSADDYLVATFGFATPAKSLESLIHAWSISSLATNPQAHLLIVGEFLDERYQTRIHRLLDLRPCKNIRLLGYVDQPTYHAYLHAADLAVQLRIRSRGET